MPTTVNLREAKARLSHLLERVRAGEEIILATAGKPYARLVPLPRESGRRPGRLPGRVGDAFFEPLPEEEPAGWAGK